MVGGRAVGVGGTVVGRRVAVALGVKVKVGCGVAVGRTFVGWAPADVGVTSIVVEGACGPGRVGRLLYLSAMVAFGAI